MSQYSVQYHNEAPTWLAAEAAGLAYNHPDYPWARQEFSTDEYILAVCDDTEGSPVLAAYSGPTLVAAISFTDLMEDPHCPGQGSFIAYSVAHPEHPGAAGVLLRRFIEGIRSRGASWYCISKRLDRDTVLTKYRRLHE